MCVCVCVCVCVCAGLTLSAASWHLSLAMSSGSPCNSGRSTSLEVRVQPRLSPRMAFTWCEWVREEGMIRGCGWFQEQHLGNCDMVTCKR